MSSLHTGRAGEYRVISELLLREHEPTLSIIDDGIDLYCLDCNNSIQVKASLHPTGTGGNRKYHFSIQTWHRDAREFHKAKFIICWGVETNDFWVIPTQELLAGRSLNITVPYSKTYQKYKDAWHLLGVVETSKEES